jgi:hypothetical protein
MGCSIALLDGIRYSNSFESLMAIVDQATGTGAEEWRAWMNEHIQITCSKPDLEDLLGKEVDVTLVIRGQLTGYYDNAIVLGNVGSFPQYLIETNQPGFEIRSVLPKTIKS